MAIIMNISTLANKFITCLVAGIVTAALLLVIGNSGNVPFLPPVLIFSLVGFSFIGSIIFPFIWQNLENKQKIDSEKINSFLYALIRYAIAFNLISFGWKKILGLQFVVPTEVANKPMNQQSGEWLTWYYFGFSEAFGYILAFIQIGGSFLLLFRRTVLIGSFILFTFMLNLLLVNIFYQMNAGAVTQSIIITIGLVYLILLDYSKLYAFFLEPNDQKYKAFTIQVNIKNIARVSILVISLLFAFYLKSLV
jgi:hypothetical protein